MDSAHLSPGATRGRRSQRIASYGVCRDTEDRLLLARASPTIAAQGHWFLPGGGVQHGEHPPDSLRREVHEESGLTVTVGPLLDVLSDVRTIPEGISLHTVRLVYRIASWHGTLRPEVGGTTDAVGWFTRAELERLPLAAYVQTVVEHLL